MASVVPAPPARPRFGKPGPYRGPVAELARGMAFLFLRATGWRAANDWPGVPKSVIVAAPHTSNLDGFVMLALAAWYRQKLSWMGKASLVRGPLGGFVRWMGCVPVDRSRSDDVVAQMKEAFDSTASLHLAVAPEGTREANADWKSGFWHIAKSAGVPILVAVLDYRSHIMRFEGPIEPGESYEADLKRILAFYEGADGRYPERFLKPAI